MVISRKRYSWPRRASCWLILALVLGPGVLPAAVFTTGTLNDSPDDDRSLRYLVRNSQWGDTIVLGMPGTIVLSALFGEIHVDHDLTITAMGLPRDYTISGNNASRIFSVSSGAGPMPTLNISNLTLYNGLAENSFHTGGGAIIASDANLNLSACVVSSNAVIGSSGGGIGFGGGGICNITDCTILTNTSGGAGGGLDFEGAVPGSSVLRSTFSGNLAYAWGGWDTNGWARENNRLHYRREHRILL